MFMLPLAPLVLLLVNLVSVALLGVGGWLVIGWVYGTLTIGFLIAGIVMLLFTFFGRYLVLLLLGGHSGKDEPKFTESPENMRLKRPDGTELYVEFLGPADAPPLVLTHGIATVNSDWYYVKNHLADRFRLILWDVRGLGKSSRAPNRDYSLEAMAGDLEAVLGLATKPAILVGHSMGGMITLTFCRLFPQHLGQKVAGLGLVNTTYLNPVNTATARGFLRAVQKPLLEPILYLVVGLSPLVWLMSWLSYLNGTAHIASRFSSFSGKQTRGQLEFMTVCQPLCSPAVLARQMLAMFHHDNTQVLPQINVPTLVVAANHDRGCIPEASQFMHNQISGSQLAVMQPSGHVSIFEQNEQFVIALAVFASSVNKNSKSMRVQD
ncbi:MAG: alpha/beta hydrolase [Chloroflexi bacterium]|nr:alpha/beta hydrolase [Chloroflexota bacterium]OJV90203.1 MAG: alpha/beta hydrolase [Chloroflexi bacterium 54-19]